MKVTLVSYLTRAGVGGGIIVASFWLTARVMPVTRAPVAPSVTPSSRRRVAIDAGIDARAPLLSKDASPPAGGDSPSPSLPQAHPLSETLCPKGMVWAGGEFCPIPVSPGDTCPAQARQVSVCIDPYEYPNRVGVAPAVMNHFHEARRYCEAEGKRLCTETEWTQACRDPLSLTACNFGQSEKRVPVEAFRDRNRVSEAVAQFEGRRRSGESLCSNRFGAFDMLGNVQEWVLSERGPGYEAALKGGRYNQTSVACDRSIQTQMLDARLPHTGFRCCQDPLTDVAGGAGESGP